MDVFAHPSTSDISFEVAEYEEFSRYSTDEAPVKTWRSKFRLFNVVLLGLGLLCMVQAILNICLRLSLGDGFVALSSTPGPITQTLTPQINASGEVASCPKGWQMFVSSCYYFSSQARNWDDSRRDCIQRGADLVIIDNQREQAFLTRFTVVAWVGMTDRKKEGTFVWVDGTPVNRNQLLWAPGQPDNSNGREHCGDLRNMVNFLGLNDYECKVAARWICEKAPS